MKGKKLKIKKIIIIAFAVGVLFLGIYGTYNAILRNLYPKQYSNCVEKYSTEYGIDEDWVYSIIKAESNFKVDSVSQSGAVRTYATYGRNSFGSCKRN